MGSKKRKSLRPWQATLTHEVDQSGTTLHLSGEGTLERLWSTPCLGKLLDHSVRWNDRSQSSLLQFAPDAAVVELCLKRVPPQSDTDVAVTVTGVKDSISEEDSWRLLQTGLVTSYSLCTVPDIVLRCHVAARSLCEENSVPWLLGRLVPATLNEELSYFVELVQLMPSEVAKRQQFIAKVKAAIASYWERATVCQYGSFAYGLSLPHSDVDLCITGIALDPVDGLQAATNILERAGISCRPILSARVPVVKLRDRSAGVVADLTWAAHDTPSKATDSVECIATCLERFPMARDIVLVLKALLQQHEYHEPKDGGLGSLALTVMVIAFFEAHSAVRAVPKWHHCCCPDMKDAGEILIDFLRFYGLEFDYLANFVTIAGAFPSVSAKHLAPQPTVVFDRTGMYTVIVVQDPTNPQNNLASCCRESQNILQLFHKCHAALTSGDGSRSGPSMLSLVLSAEEWLWERTQLQGKLRTPSGGAQAGKGAKETDDIAVYQKVATAPIIPRIANGGAAPPQPCAPLNGTPVHQRQCSTPFHVKQLLQHLRPPLNGRPGA